MALTSASISAGFKSFAAIVTAHPGIASASMTVAVIGAFYWGYSRSHKPTELEIAKQELDSLVLMDLVELVKNKMKETAKKAKDNGKDCAYYAMQQKNDTQSITKNTLKKGKTTGTALGTETDLSLLCESIKKLCSDNPTHAPNDITNIIRTEAAQGQNAPVCFHDSLFVKFVAQAIYEHNNKIKAAEEKCTQLGNPTKLKAAQYDQPTAAQQPVKSIWNFYGVGTWLKSWFVKADTSHPDKTALINPDAVQGVDENGAPIGSKSNSVIASNTPPDQTTLPSPKKK